MRRQSELGPDTLGLISTVWRPSLRGWPQAWFARGLEVSSEPNSEGTSSMFAGRHHVWFADVVEELSESDSEDVVTE